MMVLFGEGEENGVMVEKRWAQLVLIHIPDRKADRVKEKREGIHRILDVWCILPFSKY